MKGLKHYLLRLLVPRYLIVIKSEVTTVLRLNCQGAHLANVECYIGCIGIL